MDFLFASCWGSDFGLKDSGLQGIHAEVLRQTDRVLTFVSTPSRKLAHTVLDEAFLSFSPPPRSLSQAMLIKGLSGKPHYLFRFVSFSFYGITY